MPPDFIAAHRQSSPSVVLRTPAKLNLFLELLGKRSDGFHELETILVAVGLYDTLRLTIASDHDGVRLTSRWRPSEQHWQRDLGPAAAQLLLSIPDDERNLIHRAIRRVREAYRLPYGIDVSVNKRIPAGAGMGGGSSDAAAAIRGMAQLAGLTAEDDRRRLLAIAAELGSDVPFFLQNWVDQRPTVVGDRHAAIGRGRGEILQPFALSRPLWFVTVYPPQAISTAAVYANCRIPEVSVSAEELLAQLTSADADPLNYRFVNRLLDPAKKMSTVIEPLLRLLGDSCQAAAMMTGSGSACFAICRDRQAAVAGAERVRHRLKEQRDFGHVMVFSSVAADPQVRIGR